jgi:hypothetical protein
MTASTACYTIDVPLITRFYFADISQLTDAAAAAAGAASVSEP